MNSAVNGHLDCFQFGSITSKAVTNILVLSFYGHTLTFSWVYPYEWNCRVGVFDFIRNSCIWFYILFLKENPWNGVSFRSNKAECVLQTRFQSRGQSHNKSSSREWSQDAHGGFKSNHSLYHRILLAAPVSSLSSTEGQTWVGSLEHGPSSQHICMSWGKTQLLR